MNMCEVCSQIDSKCPLGLKRDDRIMIISSCSAFIDFKEEQCEDTEDLSNAENHYDLWNGIEAIDIMKNCLSLDEYRGFLKGNILKYQLRLGKKDNVEKEMIKIKYYREELDSLLPAVSHIKESIVFNKFLDEDENVNHVK